MDVAGGLPGVVRRIEASPADEVLQAPAVATVVQDVVDDELVLCERCVGVTVRQSVRRGVRRGVGPRYVLEGGRAVAIVLEAGEVDEILECWAAGRRGETDGRRARAEGDDGVRAAVGASRVFFVYV
jgi:hypothetical protein